MSCCGQKRARFRARTSAQIYDVGEVTPIAPPQGSAFFEYVGGTAMTVVGPATGVRYRFGWPGAQAAIDLRDADALTVVPNLRRVVD